MEVRHLLCWISVRPQIKKLVNSQASIQRESQLVTLNKPRGFRESQFRMGNRVIIDCLASNLWAGEKLSNLYQHPFQPYLKYNCLWWWYVTTVFAYTILESWKLIFVAKLEALIKLTPNVNWWPIPEAHL